MDRLSAQAAVVQRSGSRRVLFHSFSMAGWVHYAALLRHMCAIGSTVRIEDVCGAIVDSAPQITVRSLLIAEDHVPELPAYARMPLYAIHSVRDCCSATQHILGVP